MKSAGLTPELRDNLRSSNRAISFLSGLSHVSQFDGWQKGKIHSLIAQASGGKSTYIRSIIYDLLKKNPGTLIFLWLSEVSVEDFMRELAQLPADVDYSSLYLHSEVESNDDMDSPDAMRILEEKVIQSGCEFFIFDNLTTSSIYGEQVLQQGKISTLLKRLVSITGAAFLLVAHTDSKVKQDSKNIIDMNDIRGSRKIVNLSEFFFILQNIQIGNTIKTTLRITKHRGKDVKQRLFYLPYDAETFSYPRDVPLEFDSFKEIKRAIVTRKDKTKRVEHWECFDLKGEYSERIETNLLKSRNK